MVVVTRWQLNAPAREAKRNLDLSVAHMRDRQLARAIKLHNSAVPVGTLIRKEFNGKLFQGKVVSGPKWKYDAAFREDTICYRIEYVDGDSEDARRDELNHWKDEEIMSVEVIEAFFSNKDVIQEFFTETTITL